jgi:hypothetical protein
MNESVAAIGARLTTGRAGIPAGLRVALATAAYLTLCPHANATVIGSLPDGVADPFPLLDIEGNGTTIPAPVKFDGGITWSTNEAAAVFGYDGGFVFGHNGVWMGLDMSSAVFDGSITFAFSRPVSAVGGFLNYVPYAQAEQIGLGPAILSVYDASGHLIQTTQLKFTNAVDSVNSGEFVGFSEKTPIAYFQLTGGGIGITDLTTVPVPEPATWAFMLAGIGLLSVAWKSRSE